MVSNDDVSSISEQELLVILRKEIDKGRGSGEPVLADQVLDRLAIKYTGMR